MMRQPIRIGTRESQLAVWQAQQVSALLSQHGFENTLVYIKSEGDLNLTTPLYELGVQGIFTRTLDAALLNNRIDIAVHSMKDVPVQLPTGIVEAAVLERGNFRDVLVFRNADTAKAFEVPERSHTIATSSVRRRAQWLHRFPETAFDNIRGNVNTRLHKLSESFWTGALFAAAGLERIGIFPPHVQVLDWMLPAPAQGAIMVVCRQEDVYLQAACQAFHHTETALCAHQERQFLKALMGGCTAPISAYAHVSGSTLHLEGSLLSVDGKQKLESTVAVSLDQATTAGVTAAAEILAAGGAALLPENRLPHG